MLPFYHFIDESIKVKKASLGFVTTPRRPGTLIIVIVKLAPALAPWEALETGRGRVQGVVNFYFPSSCYFQTRHIPEKPPLHSSLFQEFNSREAKVWWMTPCPDQEIQIKFTRRVSQEVFFVNQASNQDYIFIWMQKLNGFLG